MPWTVTDVDKHKKGLSAKQKNQWVSVANSVREKCMKEGEDEKTCDAKAIRQANGVVNNMETIAVHIDTQIEYTAVTKLFENKEYLVVPVVMMVEGVHNGSRGPVYHDPVELGKIPQSWNGIPVTISHPKTDEEGYISANSPEIFERYSVGKIFNTYFEEGKLKAEAWIEVQKLIAVSPDTLADIQAGKIIEVSVGVFSDEDEIEGNWNEEKYVAVAKNYRPDHLALLPGEVGACSVTDGCGVRVNNEKNDVKLKKEEEVMACEKCPEKVDELIANSATHFGDSDRDWLLELSEDKLDKLIPKRVRVNAEVIPESKSPTVDEAWNVIQANAKNEDYLNHLPKDMKGLYEEGVKVLKEQRETLMKSIMDNTEKDTWTKAELEAMDLNVLKKLDKSINKDDSNNSGVNYVAMSAGTNGNGDDVDIVPPLAAPGVKFE